jgi:hypothetical protein
MTAPFPTRLHPVRPQFRVVAFVLVTICAAAVARAENAEPRVIETRPLKLLGDGSTPPAPPAQNALTITTPPLRLIGDGSAPTRETPPAARVTIETRPLKLIGAKP